MINLLLRHVIDSKLPVRIINVASGTHDPALKTGMPDPRIPPKMIALAYPEQDDDPQKPKDDDTTAGRRAYAYAEREKMKVLALRANLRLCAGRPNFAMFYSPTS